MQIKQIIALHKEEIKYIKEKVKRIDNLDNKILKAAIELIAFKYEEIKELEKLVE